MHDQYSLFMEYLQNDEKLLSLLAENKPFWNKNLPSKNKYSILPADKIYKGLKTPFISVQITNESLIDTKLTNVFLSVRCYNEPDKTNVTINNVLSRVKVILHNHRFAQYADNAISVNSIYESTGGELNDQPFDLNFRESQYRISYL